MSTTQVYSSKDLFLIASCAGQKRVLFCHCSGRVPLAAESWKSFVSGVTNSFRSLCRTCGCIPSGPGDLSTFNFVSFSITSCIDISSSGRMFPPCLSSMVGMFSLSYMVKTLVKNWFSTSAFSVSVVATVPSSLSRSPTGTLTFIPLFTCLQNVFTSVFKFLANFFSNVILALLTSLVAWFRFLLKSSKS